MGYRLRTVVFLVALTAAGIAVPGCSGVAAKASDRSGSPGGRADGAAAQAPAHEAAVAAEPRPMASQVVIDTFAFQPAKLTVAAGTKVTWVNHDDVPHTATSRDKPRLFSSGALDTDDTFSHTFTAPGTYEYFCALHPHMTAQILVK